MFGDSVAQVTAWGLANSYAASKSGIEVISMGAGACPLAGDSYRWDQSSNGGWNEYCDISAVLDAIAEYRPDGVLAVFTLANQTDVRIAGEWVNLDDSSMRSLLLERMVEVAEVVESTGSVLLWASAPLWSDIPEMFTVANQRSVAHNHVIHDFLQTRPEVTLFPLGEQYSTLGVDAFHDGVHLSKSAAVAMADSVQVEHILTTIGQRGRAS